MPKVKTKSLSTKLDIDVIESARIIAALRGEMITDLLSCILRPVLSQMENDEMKKRFQKSPVGSKAT